MHSCVVPKDGRPSKERVENAVCFYKHFYSEGEEEIWEILEESGRKQEEWERKTGPAGTGLEIGRHESRIFWNLPRWRSRPE